MSKKNIPNIIMGILIFFCFIMIFFPSRYSVTITPEKNGNINNVKMISKGKKKTIDAVNNRVDIDYSSKKEWESMSIHSDTSKLMMTIRWNGIPIKKISKDVLENNGEKKYSSIEDELPDYTLAELLETYGDSRYIVMMGVCNDYSDGMSEALVDTFKQYGVESTPADTGENSSFYVVLQGKKLIKSESSNNVIFYFEENVAGHFIEV